MKTVCAILLLFAAIDFTVRTRCIQLRRLGSILLQPFHSSSNVRKGISAFEAASASLAATIGTGNIAGVAGAILLGGPGALFWIWVSGFLGMALKYSEIYISMRFRKRIKNGEWRGGPMYWPAIGLSGGFQVLGVLFALFGVSVSLGMGDLVQISTVAESMEALAESIGCGLIFDTPCLVRALTGILIAGFLLPVMQGGAERISRLASVLVPPMSIVYLLFCTIGILKNHASLPQVFRDILLGAFCPQAILGSASGIGIRKTLQVGLSRGIFSHEAGLGTAAIAHSCAEHTSAAEQARYGAFEVFFDVLICSVTGFAVLSAEIPLPYGAANINSGLVIDALAACFGKRLSAAAVSVSLLLFAFSSMTGFALYGSRCAEFLFGRRGILPFQTVFLLICAVGPLLPRSRAWELSELLNGILCIPNLTLMFLLVNRNKQLRADLQDSQHHAFPAVS